MFGRYSRRANVDTSSTDSSYTQHDSSGQFFLNVSRHTQIFGVATVTQQELESGGGSTFLQFTGGGQQQIFDRGLWLRLEGTATRNHDHVTDLLAPRDALSGGLNGQLTPQTTIGFNVYLDRAPAGFAHRRRTAGSRDRRCASSTPFQPARRGSPTPRRTAARRVEADPSSAACSRTGTAMACPMPAKTPCRGFPCASELAHVRDHFARRSVQLPERSVWSAETSGLDVKALPVDFDPPAAPDLMLELSRGETRRVAFALVPLGGIRGRVVEDANRNGQADPGEAGIEGAVLTLDGGSRSELARKGTFRFEAVRSGDHHVELLKESLPDGAIVAGGTERSVSITREHPQNELTYLVVIEKRPEVRKVFPPRIGATGPGRGNNGTPAAKPADLRPRRDERAGTPSPAGRSGRRFFTIQVAALSDSGRAHKLVDGLKDAGFDAYLVEPAAANSHGPYRVRVGRYDSREVALRTITRLEAQMGEKLWLTTVTAR